ncbi:MAG: DoxX family protein [Clostridia bacterium]|nr:DoxX family protein [Clostridia bacterium]
MRGSFAWADLPLRLATALVFFLHGYPKLLAPAQTAGFFARLGIPLPLAAAVAVGALEAVGAVLLACGLWTRWVAALLAVDMVAAILLVKGAMGFPEAEIDVVLLGSSLYFALAGPGSIAVDRALGGSRRLTGAV